MEQSEEQLKQLEEQLKQMEEQFKELEHVLVYKDGRHFLRSKDVFTPVHLKEYDTLEQAEQQYQKLMKVANYHVAVSYPPFPSKEGSKGYIALFERGTSLEEYLEVEGNLEKMFSINNLKNRPDRASRQYKDIIRGLLIAGKGLMQANLICKFKLSNIFVFESSEFDVSEFHVEVADFESGNVSDMWDSLHHCLETINTRVADYVVAEDVEMIEVLNLLKNRDNEKLMKSTFFWDWHKKKYFIFELKEALKNLDGRTYSIWSGQCGSCFLDWETKVQQEPDLNKFFQYFTEKQMSEKSGLPKPINFILNCFTHFFKVKIEALSMATLQRKLEDALGQYTHKLCSIVVQQKKLTLESLDFTIWESRQTDFP
ncbi:hypothetical protein PTKIN_Ptkin01aG0323700 [Pterospermum kingtungense]